MKTVNLLDSISCPAHVKPSIRLRFRCVFLSIGYTLALENLSNTIASFVKLKNILHVVNTISIFSDASSDVPTITLSRFVFQMQDKNPILFYTWCPKNGGQCEVSPSKVQFPNKSRYSIFRASSSRISGRGEIFFRKSPLCKKNLDNYSCYYAYYVAITTL